METMRVVCVWDAAIDTHPETGIKIAEYATKRDFGSLKFVPGIKPVVFHLRPIPRDLLLTYVMAVESKELREVRAFQCAVEKVTGRADDDPWFPSLVSMAAGDSRITRRTALLSEQELELFDMPTILEIGGVAWDRSFLVQGIAAGFTLRPTSHQTFVAALVSRAVSTQE